MASLAELIDFLMSMMRDEETKASFDRDPDGTLADRGLGDVSTQDVRDARLIMADDGTARPRPGGAESSRSNDPVQEIRHTTNTYEIDQSRHVGDVTVDQTVIGIDDRDTTVIDSFNSADEVTAIQDNDTIDITNVEDSFNEVPEGGTSPEEPVETLPVEDGETSVQPVDDPDGEPFGTAPEPEPEVSVQPVDEVEDEPDLDTAETAVV
jgi:hypothetical protein